MTKNSWKVCNRGHKFRGSVCVICYPGRLEKKKDKKYVFNAKLWVYPGDAGWHFITVPKTISTKIKDKYSQNARGWRSIPVSAKLGKTIWQTSIFPDSKSGAYLLPVKSAIRKKEKTYGDKTYKFSITVEL